MAAAAAGGREQTRTIRRVAISSMIGNATEWYDYFIYGTASALVFGQLFFPTADPLIGTLLAFATFGVTFLVRPLGALIFGHFGDRVGRKRMLIFSILIMGVGTFIIGLLPTYGTIGIWAPILLVLMRLFQGFAVGGEYGGAISMTMEYAPPNKRGFYTAMAAAGLSLGLVLATAIMYLFVGVLSDAQFLSWGWRIPFLLSAVLVLIGLYIRLRIVESPVFLRAQERAQQQGEEVRAPLVEIVRNYKIILLLVLLIPTAVNVSFYIASSWSISYLTDQVGVTTLTVLGAVTIAAILDFFAQLFFGGLSDRLGRRPVYIMGSLAIGLGAFPFFWLLNTGNFVWILLGMILLIPIGHGATYSVQAIYFAELFGTGVRYSGLSIGYHIGAAITSGPGPFVAAAILAATGSTWGISLVIIGAAVVSIVATLMAAETYRRDIEEDSIGESKKAGRQYVGEQA